MSGKCTTYGGDKETHNHRLFQNVTKREFRYRVWGDITITLNS